MGSNKRKHFDRGMLEWGSKARKEEAHTKKRSMNEASIDDSTADGAPTHNSKKRKKDTKRWCRGKVGREHIYIRIGTTQGYFCNHEKHQCTGCQKFKYMRIN